MSLARSYGKYLKNEVEGASQGKLIVMMYDGTMRFIRAAIQSIDEKDIQGAHNNIIRAENIIYELMSTLNMEEGGEVAHHLMRIYDFVIWHLVDANNSKDSTKLNEAIKVLQPLRDAWKEIVDRENASKIGNDTEKSQEKPQHKSINFAG